MTRPRSRGPPRWHTHAPDRTTYILFDIFLFKNVFHNQTTTIKCFSCPLRKPYGDSSSDLVKGLSLFRVQTSHRTFLSCRVFAFQKRAHPSTAPLVEPPFALSLLQQARPSTAPLVEIAPLNSMFSSLNNKNCFFFPKNTYTYLHYTTYVLFSSHVIIYYVYYGFFL